MKNRIIEICELGHPQSIIHRQNEPITELINTYDLVDEINEQLRLLSVVRQSEQLECPACGSKELHSHSDGYVCEDCNNVIGAV